MVGDTRHYRVGLQVGHYMREAITCTNGVHVHVRSEPTDPPAMDPEAAPTA